MYLQFEDEQGFPQEYELKEKPIIIGRSRDAEIQFFDTKLSREHCGIKFNAGAYELKDLGSKNGTYLNNEKVENTTALKVGDKIRVGGITMQLVDNLDISTTGAFQDINQRMEDGAGFKTIMRQIVKDVDSQKDPK